MSTRGKWLKAVRLGLGLLFVLAGALKLAEPSAFAASVATFRFFPRGWTNLIAVTVPPIEILMGALVIVSPWQRVAAFGLSVFNLAFLILLTQAMLRGLSFECGCFGAWDPLASRPWLALPRDVLLLLGSLAVYRTCARPAALYFSSGSK
jgi:putative oxidoreductase